MKKFKLLVLALIIGASNLFATNIFPDDPLIKGKKPPVNKLLYNTTLLNSPILLFNKDLNLKIAPTNNYGDNLIILEVQSKNEDVLMSILENIKIKRRISAIRNYSDEMPSIMRKE